MMRKQVIFLSGIVGIIIASIFLFTWSYVSKLPETPQITASSVAVPPSTEKAKQLVDAMPLNPTDSKKNIPVRNAQYDNAQTFISLFLASLAEADDIERYEKRDKAYTFEKSLNLNRESSIEYARNLITTEEGLIVYHGATLLITYDRLGEAVPALADLVVSGKDQTGLNGRMGYDWMHMGMDTRGILFAIDHYLLDHFDEYGSTEKNRVITFLCSLSLCKVDSFSKEATINALLEQEKKSE